MLAYSGCKIRVIRPPLNQKAFVKQYNAKAARVYVSLFLQECGKKDRILKQIKNHSRIINLAAFSMKQHMHIKNKQVKKLVDGWEKAIPIKNNGSWENDLRKAHHLYNLGRYTPISEHLKLLTK